MATSGWLLLLTMMMTAMMVVVSSESETSKQFRLCHQISYC